MILWMFIIIICIIVVVVVVAMIIIVIVKFIRLVGDCDGLIILHSHVFFSVDHYLNDI